MWLTSSSVPDGAHDDEVTQFRRLKKRFIDEDEDDGSDNGTSAKPPMRRLKRPKLDDSDDDNAPLLAPPEPPVAPKVEVKEIPADRPVEHVVERVEKLSKEAEELDEIALQERDYLQFRMVTSDIKQKVAEALGGAENCETINELINRGRCSFTRSYNPPPTILRDNPTLKPYQVAAIHWLLTLYENGLNGLVADDMGLGKSAECICFLRRLYQDKRLTLPTVVACPTTLLENWKNEFDKWAPELRVLKYHGTQNERKSLMRKWKTGMDEEDMDDDDDEEEEDEEEDSPPKDVVPAKKESPSMADGCLEVEKLDVAPDSGCAYHVMITTHGILSKDFDRRLFFKAYDFGYMVVDEAHTLKNAASQRYQQMNRSINAPYRLLLTGSPVQNQISELRNLLTFLNPYRHATFDLDRALLYHSRMWKKAVKQGKRRVSRTTSREHSPATTDTETGPTTKGTPDAKSSIRGTSDTRSVDKTEVPVKVTPPKGSVATQTMKREALPQDARESKDSASEESTTHRDTVEKNADPESPGQERAVNEVVEKSGKSNELRKHIVEPDNPITETPDKEPSEEKAADEEAVDMDDIDQSLQKTPEPESKTDVKMLLSADASSSDCQVMPKHVDESSTRPEPSSRGSCESEETATKAMSSPADLPAHELALLTSQVESAGGNGLASVTDPEVLFYQQLLAPLILRRLKAEVIDNFPRKTNKIELCEMTPLQRSLYDNEMLSARPILSEVNSRYKSRRGGKKVSPAKEGAGTPQAFIKGLLFRLRRICNHPLLSQRFFDAEMRADFATMLKKNINEFRRHPLERVAQHIADWSDFEIYVYAKTCNFTKFNIPPEEFLESCKILRMMELVDELVGKKQKVLIFSQFTTYLDVIQEVFFLHRPEIAILRLDGKTAVDDRSLMVSAFQADNSDYSVFLLSTKAGGVGLNLTKASTVLLMDQDWNPHNDRQAEDRVHRLGQTDDVVVYRLCCRHSFEETILSCCKKKLELDEAFGGTTDSLPLEIFEDMISTVQSYHPAESTSPSNNSKTRSADHEDGRSPLMKKTPQSLQAKEEAERLDEEQHLALKRARTRKHNTSVASKARPSNQTTNGGRASKTTAGDKEADRTGKARNAPKTKLKQTKLANAASQDSAATTMAASRAQRRTVLLPGGDSDDE